MFEFEFEGAGAGASTRARVRAKALLCGGRGGKVSMFHDRSWGYEGASERLHT